MYKSCSHCGIVPDTHICPYRRAYRTKVEDTKAKRFRSSSRWTNKSIEIKQRDKYLCQVCIRNLYSTLNVLNYDKLEVHHIVPINEDYEKRLDNDNLITLCTFHHKMADANEIPREELAEMVSRPLENIF